MLSVLHMEAKTYAMKQTKKTTKQEKEKKKERKKGKEREEERERERERESGYSRSLSQCVIMSAYYLQTCFLRNVSYVTYVFRPVLCEKTEY